MSPNLDKLDLWAASCSNVVFASTPLSVDCFLIMEVLFRDDSCIAFEDARLDSNVLENDSDRRGKVCKRDCAPVLTAELSPSELDERLIDLRVFV